MGNLEAMVKAIPFVQANAIPEPKNPKFLDNSTRLLVFLSFIHSKVSS